MGIIIPRLSAILAGRNDRNGPYGLNHDQKGVRVVTFVRNNVVAVSPLEQRRALSDIVHLAGRTKSMGVPKASTTIWILVLKPPQGLVALSVVRGGGTCRTRMRPDDGAIQQQAFQVRLTLGAAAIGCHYVLSRALLPENDDFSLRYQRTPLRIAVERS
jgi:hypothetical protein